MKTLIKITLGTLLALVLFVGGCTALVGGVANEIDKDIKEDTANAMADTEVTACGGYDMLDGPLSKVRITNTEKSPQDYYVEVTYKDADGNTIGTGSASIENLDPGKTWQGKATSLDTVKPHVEFTCGVTDVTAIED